MRHGLNTKQTRKAKKKLDAIQEIAADLAKLLRERAEYLVEKHQPGAANELLKARGEMSKVLEGHDNAREILKKGGHEV